MATRHTTKQGKDDARKPAKSKAEPLADGPSGMTAKRRRHVESLLDGLIQMARMSRSQGQEVEPQKLLNGDVEKSFGAICDEYGTDLLVVIGERLEHATPRTDDETIFEHADILTSMMIHVRNPELFVADEINLTLEEIQTVVPVLMNQLEALVETHRVYNCNDQALEEVIWALNLSGDAGAQDRIMELAQEEGLVRDVRSLHCWKEQNGDLVAKPDRRARTMSPERREEVTKALEEARRLIAIFADEIISHNLEFEDDGGLTRSSMSMMFNALYDSYGEDMVALMKEKLGPPGYEYVDIQVVCDMMANWSGSPDYEVLMPDILEAVKEMAKLSPKGGDYAEDLQLAAHALYATGHPSAIKTLRQVIEEFPKVSAITGIGLSNLTGD